MANPSDTLVLQSLDSVKTAFAAIPPPTDPAAQVAMDVLRASIDNNQEFITARLNAKG